MLACKRCGKENQDHYKFCLGCGAELTGPPPAKQNDMAMMKTMMADVGQSAALPTSHPPGFEPASAPRSHQPQRPATGGGYQGSPPADYSAAPPSGGYSPPNVGAHPAGPPPGVPSLGGLSPLAPRASATRVCHNCNTAVPQGFKFCGACGTPFSEAAPPPAVAQPASITQPRGTLTLIRPDGSQGGSHSLEQGENKMGRLHGEIFENDSYLSPTHAELILSDRRAVIRDLDSLNGVFVRMTGEEMLNPGQVIRMGQELLRFDPIVPPEPLEDGTEIMGSPNPGYWGKITVIIGDGVDGSAYPFLGDSVTLGRERGDINFPDDGYVSGLHARLFTRDGHVFVADLGSSNGTFIKVQGEREIGNDSFILVGQQLFKLTIQ